MEHSAAIAMLNIHGMTHNAIQSSSPKINNPTIGMESSPEEWAYFLARWKTYKAVNRIAEGDKVAFLMECCENELRNSIYQTHGPLEDQNEQTVLATIEQHAVRAENVAVARMDLMKMFQDRDEPVARYVARLTGKARTCKYTIKREGKEWSYCDEMVYEA